MTEDVEMSECCRRLLLLINKLRENIDMHPPQEIQSRYGNPAYREWSATLEESADKLLEEVLPENLILGLQELKPYLVDSFG